jgi:hypothetical protein
MRASGDFERTAARSNEMVQIQLWVDDQRCPPPGFNAHAKTYAEAIRCLDTGKVVAISLDHDRGEEKTGYDVAAWIEARAFYGEIPEMIWAVHTANPIGAVRIAQAMKNAASYWDEHRCG